jgi:hypothetical protein
MDTVGYKNYGYSDEQIEAEITKNQNAILEAYYSAIQNAENAIREYELQVETIDAQLSAISSGQDTYVVTANATGTLHLLADYRAGMVVQTAGTVATITAENDETIFETVISAADRTRVKVGDKAEVAVFGLNQTIFGTIPGTLTEIDSDATVSEDQNSDNSAYFKIRIIPDFTYLVSRSGEMVNLSNGMAVEARIEYDKITYFNYVIEKLGFYTR